MFVDTGAFVALRNRAEREHEAAREALAALVADRAQLLTFELRLLRDLHCAARESG